jgi:hypothetical protein
MDNYAVDREAAERAIAANPGIVADVRANRAFLARVVRYLAGECSVGQFLDIGTGLPTVDNTMRSPSASPRNAGSCTPTTTVASLVVHTQITVRSFAHAQRACRRS